MSTVLRLKKKKKWYQQSFNAEWLKNPELKDWVKLDPNDKCAAVCSVCDFKLKNCNKSSLMQHKASAKHLKNYNAKRSVSGIQAYLKKKPAEDDLDDKVSKAELLLTGYVAEHGVPFRQVDHLVETMKQMFPNCEVARSLKAKRTKISCVAREEKQ